jgi:nitronate monooxygenase
METEFTRLVGCRVPIQQAGMGFVAGPDLVVAVSDAGALGTLGLGGVPVSACTAAVEAVAARTSRPFGANFLMPFLDRDAVATVAGRARVVEFFYGDPDPSLVSMVQSAGSLAAWQVGSVDEGRAAEVAGCDLVIAQGTEAGGHVRGTIGLRPLLDGLLDVVSVPVVAAGGIGSARSVAAVLAAGASAARVGTRFLAAEEADVHPSYLEALINARAEDTVLTTAFSEGWSDAPHRVLRQCVEKAESLEDGDANVGEVELAPGLRVPLPRFSTIPPNRSASGRVGAMACYAGESVGYVDGPGVAASIVAELVAGL